MAPISIVDVAETRQPVRYFASVGDRVSIHATSAGRGLLAQMPADGRERLCCKIDFVAYSPASAEAVEARIAEVAAMGWYQSDAEYTPDLAGVALP